MIFFNVFSTAIICLWSLLLATGPIYIPVFTIPALVPPVLTPLLSPQNGRIILILTEVCDAAISLPFPTCDPSEVPIYSSGSHDVVGFRWTLQLVAGTLAMVGIVLCTKGTAQRLDGADSAISAPFDCPTNPTLAPHSFPYFPPRSRDVGPTTNWTPLSQVSASGSSRCQVPTRTASASVSTYDRSFRSSPLDSGYEGSPLFSRPIAFKRRSRLRFVTSVEVGSPIPCGLDPATEPDLDGSGGDDVPPEGPSSKPLFTNPPTHQGGWALRVAGNDPFFTDHLPTRDLTLSSLTGEEISETYNTPSKKRIQNTQGRLFPVSGVTTPIPIERTRVSRSKNAREARDAFLRSQAERGYAAPSRLFCDPIVEGSISSPARTPNIQALRDLLESRRAMLRRLSEKRTIRFSPPTDHSRLLDSPPEVEEQTSWITPIPSLAPGASLKSLHLLKQGTTGIEENKFEVLNLPADMTMLVDEELPSDAVEVEGSLSSVRPLKNAAMSSRRKKPEASAAEARYPASTSMDIGLQLLRQAIGERVGRSWNMEEFQTLSESTMSVSSSLRQTPSFLGDISDFPPPMEMSYDQATRPILYAAPLSVPAPSLDILPEDAVADRLFLSAPHEKHAPPLTIPSLEIPPSPRRTDSALKDASELSVQQSSCPAVTLETHDWNDIPSSSSLDGLQVVGDTEWLMDQSAPLSPIESPTRTGSPIPPFEEVISRVRDRKEALAVQKDQVSSSARGLEPTSASQSGRPETSMSLGMIEEILDDIWSPPVHKFSRDVGFEDGQVADLPVPAPPVGTSSGPSPPVLSFNDFIQNVPSLAGMNSASSSRFLLTFGSFGFSDPSVAPSVLSSGSGDDTFCMEISEDVSLLCDATPGGFLDDGCSF